MKQAGGIIRGVLLLARGRPAGIEHFPSTVNEFTASLAPLIAFPLVGAGLLAFNGEPALAAVSFLSRLCVVLALSVITHAFARLTGREAYWLRTAIALNWSFWIIIPLLLAAAITGAALVTAGLPEPTAQYSVIGLMAVYLLWFHWFTIRCGLLVSRLQALGIMAATNAIIGLLSLGPDAINLLFAKLHGHG